MSQAITLYAECRCAKCEGIHPTSGQAGFYCDGDGGMRREVSIDYGAALTERIRQETAGEVLSVVKIVDVAFATALGKDV